MALENTSNRSIYIRVAEAFSEINHQFWLTVRDLSLKPESVVVSYLDKPETNVYLNPFRYAFIILSVYVIAASWTGFDLVSMSANSKSELVEQGLNIVDIYQFIDNSFALLIFLLLIPTAWLMSKLFRSSERSTGDCYVAALYITAQTTLALLIFALPIAFILQSQSLLMWSSVLVIPYYAWAYKNIFLQSMFAAIWKSVLSLAFLFIVEMLLFFVIGLAIGIEHAISEKHEDQKSEIKTSIKIENMNLNRTLG